MCLITFSYKQHPAYDLVFAANRDENHNRPTRPAQFWDDYPNILAGKDLKAGGTWMGVNKRGAFSAITNYRDPSIEKEDPPSRGQLVLDYLKRDRGNPEEYLKEINEEADRYMGFSMLAGSTDKLAFYTNQQKEIHLLDSGLYGLSNHLLDTSWPKVRRAKTQLHQIIQDDLISEEALFDLLTDDREAPEEELPETGIPKEIEKKISPIFIQGEEYGTRSSTILLINNSGEVTFRERRYKRGSKEVIDDNRYQFSIRDREYSPHD